MTLESGCPEKVDVVGIGAATLDDLWLVPSFSSDEAVTQAVQHAQMGGGPVATALCVLGELGNTVTLLDLTGEDPTGQLILKGLADHRVDLQGMRIVAGAQSARAVVVVRASDGARQIAFLPAEVGELTLDVDQRDLVRRARLLHINGRHENACREAMALAVASGVTVSFDGGAGRFRESLRDLVQQSQIKILSMDFARHLTGMADLPSMMNHLLSPPTLFAVVTDGVAGSHVGTPCGWRFHQPAFPALPLVDTTGCGDVYHGAFLHGWLQGWGLEECAAFASKLAALNGEGLGGRAVLAMKKLSGMHCGTHTELA